MKCLYCGKPGAGDPNSFAYFEFGAITNDNVRKMRPTVREYLTNLVEKVYKPRIVLGWHGADWDSNAPYPRISRNVILDTNHPAISDFGCIDPLQAELLFCSCSCLRKWLLWLVDLLEQSMQSNVERDSSDILNPIRENRIGLV